MSRRLKSFVDLGRFVHHRLRKRKVDKNSLKRDVLKLFMQRDEGKKVVESPRSYHSPRWIIAEHRYFPVPWWFECERSERVKRIVPDKEE